MGKHKHKTLRKQKIYHKKRSTLKHRPLKYKKHYRGGNLTSSSSSFSPSNYSLKGMYSQLKSSLGITPHSISLNKIVKTVLKDIPKEEQDQFIITLKSNLTKWIKDLGNNNTNQDPINPDLTNPDHTNQDSTNQDPPTLDSTTPDHSTFNHSNSNSQTEILPEQIISNSQISN